MSGRFDAKDALADYVTVPQRIAQFYELFGQGRLVTSDVRVEMGPDSKPRVLVQAKAYRTVDDPLPGVGWSWMELPGTTSFTKGSELENTETSAWGRAIAALGILVDKSIASANEVATKSGEPQQPTSAPQRPAADPAAPVGEDGQPMTWTEFSGRVAFGDNAATDGNARQTPDGHVMVGFRCELTDAGPRVKTVQVVGKGPMGSALQHVIRDAKGKTATCAGWLEMVKWQADKPPFRRLHLERIACDLFTIPAPGVTPQAELDAELETLPW